MKQGLLMAFIVSFCTNAAASELTEWANTKRTMADMRAIAFAMEAYALDNDDRYPESSQLKSLEPIYIRTFH